MPLPEPHLAGMLLGVVLHAFVPWPMPGNRRWEWWVGWSLVGVGALVVRWAVLTVGTGDVEHPSTLVTAGPYRWSRNPMYVAWTVLYAGVALLVGTAWMLLLLPGVVVASHRTVLREEQSLERRFGEAYRAYERDVRRYV